VRAEPEIRRKPRKEIKTRGDWNIKWIEDHCHIPEGKNVGQKVKLRPWQKAFIKRIYDNPEGTRRAIFSVGRKNAKTALSSFLLLLHLCGEEATPNSQLLSAAQSREQAAILFNLAAKVVRMSPTLQKYVTIRDTAKQLFCADMGTLYRALSAEASTAYGLSPVFIVHDELGQVKGPRSELYDALETSVGAQAEPLSIIISTQAATDADLLSVLIDDALGGHDPRTVIELHTAPLEDDPFTETTIRKANPAFGDFLSKKEVMAMAADASRMPSREAEFRNLILNQRVEASNPFVSRSVWQSCGAEVADLRGRVLYAGLDLSSVSDLTALVLIGQVNEIWQVKPTFWLPGDGIVEKSKKDRVPYDVWADEGYLELTPGPTVDYEFAAKHLFKLFNTYTIAKLGFDRWNMKHLKPWLIKAGFNEQAITDKFVEFGQGTQSMSPALRDLEALILAKKIVHGNHPVLAMCAANAIVDAPGVKKGQEKPKDDSNRKLSKNKSSGRIDGMVALTMAIGVAPLQTNIDISAMIG
jgi:phage terminase large subunit-like protein